MRKLILGVVMVLTPLVSDPAQNASSAVSALSAESISFTVNHRFQYLCYLPEKYAEKETARWPLIVFLHGRGERGSNLDELKKHGLPKLLAAGKQLPAIVVCPQCPSNEWWNIPALEAFIAEISRRLRVDADRVYLTGLSMGGFATWDLAVRNPSRYAAILPVCGGGDPALAGRLRNLPVWAFHGAKDEVVPLIRSQAMVAAIKSAGGEPRFTVYPNAGHDAWSETYANPEVYKWLLEQRRKISGK